MKNLVEDFLRQKNFAVIGSFRNESKYAFRILRRLKEKGYKVYPVNPHLDEVDGLRCYESLSDIPFPVDVVDIVTPPKVTEKILRECNDKGISRIWLQPGAQSQQAIEFCNRHNLKVIHNLCLMLEAM
jgi:predicted CoA-binding protein